MENYDAHFSAIVMCVSVSVSDVINASQRKRINREKIANAPSVQLVVNKVQLNQCILSAMYSVHRALLSN